MDNNAEDKNNKYVDRSVPWFVPVGLFLSLLFVILISYNPQLLRNITSFKVAGVEAHFASSGSATVQSGQLATLDVFRAAAVKGWAAFTYPTMKEDDYRTVTYSSKAKQDPRIIRGRRFFEANLSPIFKRLRCLQKAKSPIGFEGLELLKEVGYRLSDQIEKGSHSTDQDIAQLSRKLEDLAVNLGQECADVTKDRNYASDQADFDANYSNELPAVEETRAILQEFKKAKGGTTDIWDSYNIQAASDLLQIAFGRARNVDFLVATSTDISENGRDCTDSCIEAGDLSLSYALIAAKIQSESPWPFDETLRELDRTLAGVDHVLRAEGRSSKTDGLFRRNRLTDLSLGLQLFYQRALVGQKFTPVQLQRWSDWVKEVKQVMALVADAGTKWPTDLDDDEKRSWLNATQYITAAILQDAAIGVALGDVLIASQSGEPSNIDCLNARSLFNYAKNENLAEYFRNVELEIADRESYKGFLEQVKGRIDGACG